ncbi:hypothetical protein [Streptomyces sp. MZ04]|uniref:hypothetical protein n=1 Tax=Streptomyces sp. MZ04 TaxID=2559236 RepID=UPI00107EC649|nr:hypothetical protein [Streptomyces sp. MZ04]TGA96954.1 hypothetical protein E2651_31935 [Streptomyces sp. MZ04]
MTEGISEGNLEGTPEARHENTAPYTDAARARLATAFEACDLADLARAAVPIGEHELLPDGTVRSPGSVLAEAAQVLASARRLLEAAAVFERIGGASWQLIGDILGVEARSARVRFALAEAQVREELRRPERAGPQAVEAGWWRTYATGAPLEAARDLDDWVLRHADADGEGGGDGDGDSGLGTAPVSGGLVRAEPRRPTQRSR